MVDSLLRQGKGAALSCQNSPQQDGGEISSSQRTLQPSSITKAEPPNGQEAVKGEDDGAETEEELDAKLCERIIGDWLKTVQDFFNQQDVRGFKECFDDNGYWKDLLTLDLDMNVLSKQSIEAYLTQSKLALPNIKNLRLDSDLPITSASSSPLLSYASLHHSHNSGNEDNQHSSLYEINCFIKFDTDIMTGSGLLKLKFDPDQSTSKALIFFTQCSEVKGFEGRIDSNFDDHAQHQELHQDRFHPEREEAPETVGPKVVIIGAGQNGLMLAARLKALAIKSLVIEKSKRLGDCWRLRYDSLRLHDPIYCTRFPYLDFPKDFPVFISKDQFGDWLEEYSNRIGLDVLLESELIPGRATYDSSSNLWSLQIRRHRHRTSDGEQESIVQLKPRYLILATGLSGEPKWPPHFKDQHLFGGQVIHSSQFKSPQNYRNQKVLVIGACNSAHDISAELLDHGAQEVTIVQRSSTYVMSSENGLPTLLGGFYEPDGPRIDIADTRFMSIPLNLLEIIHQELTSKITELDHGLLSQLESVGFNLDPYPPGLLIKFFRRGGGYYIDTGCSKLIAEKKIKLKQGKEIESVTKDGVKFEGGVEIKADSIICATGYGPLNETVKKLINEDVAKSMGKLWGLDEQGEISGVWRLNSQPGFWVMCGNILQARCFSKHVAHQILLQELKIYDYNWTSKPKKIIS